MVPTRFSQNYGSRKKIPCLLQNMVTNPNHDMHGLLKGITKHMLQIRNFAFKGF